ncbi:hypothetical protein RSSM_06271 [Rhodopirellula sallentina SM41]|uniref:Uncharacterized protein n=1 Tax=Rhodopirellula sallentina SM41 TaxID=1263870 RepID=M5U366_9BACT|nr:hypothetical protein RSSM_06271 [Rhodopirellula sallentina SM41]
MMHGNLEDFDHLIEHFAVLAGRHRHQFKTVVAGQRGDNRGHFDGFGAGAKEDRYFWTIHGLNCSAQWRGTRYFRARSLIVATMTLNPNSVCF